jgi:hypothetical protein
MTYENFNIIVLGCNEDVDENKKEEDDLFSHPPHAYCDITISSFFTSIITLVT